MTYLLAKFVVGMFKAIVYLPVAIIKALTGSH